MPSLRLTEADRKRLGCPELLPFDSGSISNREAIALKEKLGFPTPNAWRRALRVVDVKDEAGKITDYELDWPAWTGLVWLALRRSGVETDPTTLEFDANFDYLTDPDPVEPTVAPGKAPARARSRTSGRKNSTSTAT